MKTLGPLSIALWFAAATFPGFPAAGAARPAAELTLPEGVDDLVFAVRPTGPDVHYYANFGYYSYDPEEKAYPIGGQLCRLNLASGEVRVLLDDPS
ncbi:MAG: hypothetical protein GXY25_06810, partial [Pirellulaceae bacterium]|nr:hypothetical protein [Pirellulaceae bacterium]